MRKGRDKFERKKKNGEERYNQKRKQVRRSQTAPLACVIISLRIDHIHFHKKTVFALGCSALLK